uniref:Uncharacterized protein n=2 Tax=Oryza meridionalis TaxID=40149 RepID=A0A0E0C2S3_9ORYZ
MTHGLEKGRDIPLLPKPLRRSTSDDGPAQRRSSLILVTDQRRRYCCASTAEPPHTTASPFRQSPARDYPRWRRGGSLYCRSRCGARPATAYQRTAGPAPTDHHSAEPPPQSHVLQIRARHAGPSLSLLAPSLSDVPPNLLRDAWELVIWGLFQGGGISPRLRGCSVRKIEGIKFIGSASLGNSPFEYCFVLVCGKYIPDFLPSCSGPPSMPSFCLQGHDDLFFSSQLTVR